MGKRKKSTRKPAQRRAREPLPTVFSCLFCNHEKSVICRLDKKMNLGFLNCKICGQNFQTSITKLSVPVDIYSEWIDAVEGGEIQDPKQIGEDDISDLSERENDRDADEEEDDEDDIGLE